jgi:hypothetical protein
MSSLRFEAECMNSFFGGSVEDMIFILRQYLANKDEMLESLHSSFHSGKEAFLNTLHFHSSVFNYVGFPQLREDCVAFVNDCKTNTIGTFTESRFQELVDKISESVSLVKAEVERLEKEHGSIYTPAD